jgi:hypothetical protein
MSHQASRGDAQAIRGCPRSPATAQVRYKCDRCYENVSGSAVHNRDYALTRRAILPDCIEREMKALPGQISHQNGA